VKIQKFDGGYVKYATLKGGDVFVNNNGSVCLRVNNISGQAVRLSDGAYITMFPDDKVTPYPNATLVVEPTAAS
jgi:hypothetical protein